MFYPGSIPEHADDLGARKLYNTCVVFGPDGEIILRHRKVKTKLNVSLFVCILEFLLTRKGQQVSTVVFCILIALKNSIWS